MTDQRPDPDDLLARVSAEEARQRRGKLKVFFGATAGVGKTYAMLQAARQQRADGVDVVVGHVETHGRAETTALLDGLERLPPRLVPYGAATLPEFDLDAALARHPALILVDELAHTNAPGSRHAKRWQDVRELLDAGINVYTTVNVQHLESLNDVVARITGIVVRETVPDSVLEQADEVELIDLPPDDLLQRLREGKVYVPEQAREAIENFFRKGNLIALRELALRSTAERVDAQMRVYMREHAIAQVWPAAERLLVCVGPSPFSARLVRTAKRMAERLEAQWIAAYVETPAHLRLPPEARDRVVQTMRLAEQLGAETVTLTGQRMSDELLAFAHAKNVTKIVVGKPSRTFWKRLLAGSIVDALVDGSGDIDVYVTSGEPEAPSVAPARRRAAPDWAGHVEAAAVIALATGLAWVMSPFFELANVVMVYLLAVIAVAMRHGRGPSLVASIVSVAAFDFFFVPPFFTFAVSDTEYLVTFGVMLVVALVISRLTIRTRDQAEAARRRERRTAALYSMSRELAGTRGVDELLRIAVRHIGEVFQSHVVVLLVGDDGRLAPRGGSEDRLELDARELAVARWTFEHRQVAGLGTGTLPGASALYVPLSASRGPLGVLGLRPGDRHALEAPEQMHQLETFANQMAVAVERAQLADEAREAQVQMETEHLRSSLLSSVSHDLRTPLATITGAVSTVLDSAGLDDQTRRELLESVRLEAERLNRLVHNLLQMTRLESGALDLRKDWHPLEEVIGAALSRLGARLSGRRVTTKVPPDLPLVAIDDVLIEQVLVNLLDNATKHTPPGSPIDILVTATDENVTVEVTDHGPGLRPGDERRVFEKFYRGPTADGQGAGLGLAICQGIVRAHGGRIWAQNAPAGGASFLFTLPLADTPPAVVTPDG
jgi:two-component system sensor histidine kinase KdpD